MVFLAVGFLRAVVFLAVGFLRAVVFFAVVFLRPAVFLAAVFLRPAVFLAAVFLRAPPSSPWCLLGEPSSSPRSSCAPPSGRGSSCDRLAVVAVVFLRRRLLGRGLLRGGLLYRGPLRCDERRPSGPRLRCPALGGRLPSHRGRQRLPVHGLCPRLPCREPLHEPLTICHCSPPVRRRVGLERLQIEPRETPGSDLLNRTEPGEPKRLEDAAPGTEASELTRGP